MSQRTRIVLPGGRKVRRCISIPCLSRMAICEEAGPSEKTAAEEGRKVKNQDAVDLGIYEVIGRQGQMERQPQYWLLLLLILSPARIHLPVRSQQKTHYLLLFK